MIKQHSWWSQKPFSIYERKTEKKQSIIYRCLFFSIHRCFDRLLCIRKSFLCFDYGMRREMIARKFLFVFAFSQRQCFRKIVNYYERANCDIDFVPFFYCIFTRFEFFCVYSQWEIRFSKTSVFERNAFHWLIDAFRSVSIKMLFRITFAVLFHIVNTSNCVLGIPFYFLFCYSNRPRIEYCITL